MEALISNGADNARFLTHGQTWEGGIIQRILFKPRLILQVIRYKAFKNTWPGIGTSGEWKRQDRVGRDKKRKKKEEEKRRSKREGREEKRRGRKEEEEKRRGRRGRGRKEERGRRGRRKERGKTYSLNDFLFWFANSKRLINSSILGVDVDDKSSASNS